MSRKNNKEKFETVIEKAAQEYIKKKIIVKKKSKQIKKHK